MGRHWTRPHSEASASRCEVRFPASSPYALACGGIAHAAAGSRHRWHRHSGLQRRLHLPEDRPKDSPLFWNYLPFSDGLLTVYEVAREFEFNSLRHAAWQVGDYRCRTTKSASSFTQHGEDLGRESLERTHRQLWIESRLLHTQCDFSRGRLRDQLLQLLDHAPRRTKDRAPSKGSRVRAITAGGVDTTLVQPLPV